MNKVIKILIITIIISLIILILGSCKEITQKDFDREASRWWVISYKIWEDADDTLSNQINGFLARPTGVDAILDTEFGEDFIYKWDELSLRDRYHYVLRRNELTEEVLVKLKGEGALKEIEGKWSLDEVPDLWKKVNNAGKGDDTMETEEIKERKEKLPESEEVFKPEAMELIPEEK